VVGTSRAALSKVFLLLFLQKKKSLFFLAVRLGVLMFAARLAGGDRRSVGEADAVAREVVEKPDRAEELWGCLASADALVRMRAADALEKVSRVRPDLLEPHRTALASGVAEDGTAEVRWNLMAIVPRLRLSPVEADAFLARVREYLCNDTSRIVRASALEAVVSLADAFPHVRADAERLLAAALMDPAPSMRARARRLLG
jgi:hypothetical protein